MLLPQRKKKILCPYCFREVNLADCAIVSTTRENTVIRHRNGTGSRLLGLLTRRHLDPDLIKDLPMRQCANSKCKKLLPYNCDHAENIIIGLVGGPTSGKGHYIAALIREIEENAALAPYGCITARPLNEKVRRTYRELYYDPLFGRNELLEGTPRLAPGSVNEPLIYTLIFESAETNKAMKTYNLVLFDAPGEQIIDEKELVEFNRYVLHSSGLIFLLDPMTMGAVRKNLPAHLKPEFVPTYEPYQTVNAIAAIYQQDKNLLSHERIDVPAAMVVSKADVLRYVARATGISSALLEPALVSVSGYSRAETQRVSAEVQETLKVIAPSGVLQAANLFRTATFHLASATGASADSTGHYPKVKPMRVVEPLVSILWQRGVIA